MDELKASNHPEQKPADPFKQMFDLMRLRKIETYKDLNRIARKNQIVFVGSSLAEMFPVYELLYHYDQRFIVYNRGISGEVIPGLLTTLDECIFELSPAKIFINIGTNDISQPGYTEESLLAGYRLVLEQIANRLPQTNIYLLSYYPVNSEILAKIPDEFAQTSLGTRTNEVIDRLNGRLVALAEELACTYIDVNSILLDSDGKLDQKYTIEGIHLKPNAYVEIQKVLVPYFA